MVKTTTVGSFLMCLGFVTPCLGASIDVGSATGSPGETVEIEVTLNQMGAGIAGVQSLLFFDAETPILDCEPNDDLDRELSRCELQPDGCTPGENCERVSCVTAGFTLSPLPDGAVLYRCMVQIACNAAEGDYVLDIDEVIASNGVPMQVPADGNDGLVTVSGAPCAPPGDDDDGGGCQTVSGPSKRAWPLVLLPLIAIFLLRRRSTER